MGLSAGWIASCAPAPGRPGPGPGQASRGAALRLLGLVGWSGSGKTTLLVALLPLLRAAGLRVSTIKHAHHGLDLDRPGKDSFAHRAAGAEEVLVVGGQRWALLRETGGAPPDLGALAARLAPVDLVLVEGFKGYAFSKIEVFREALGKPALWPETAGIVAVAAAAPMACRVPVLPLDAPDAVAGWVVSALARLEWEAG